MKLLTAILLCLSLATLPVGGVVVINSFVVSSGVSDPSFSSVVLLLHCNGADGSTTFTDSSGTTPHSPTGSGNAQIDTAESKFGGASIGADGTGDYVTVTTDADFAFGANDFTIELWVYIVSGNTCLIDFRPEDTQGAYPSLYTDSGSLYYYTNSSAQITGTAPSAGSWSHVAVSRSGTDTKIFVNGTQTGSTWTDSTDYAQGRPRIGELGFVGYGYDLNGWVDDVRVTKGVARYTSNFTPPTAAHPDS